MYRRFYHRDYYNFLLFFFLFLLSLIFFKFEEEDYLNKKRKVGIKLVELSGYEKILRSKINELEELITKEKTQDRNIEQLTALGGMEIKINEKFIFPVEGKISSQFGVRKSPFHGDMRFHEGIDIRAKEGTIVVSSSDGIVAEVNSNSTYGKFVDIRFKDFLFRYAHLSEVLIEKGEQVFMGFPIARVGNTGKSTGSHLHLETHFKDQLLPPLEVLNSNS